MCWLKPASSGRRARSTSVPVQTSTKSNSWRRSGVFAQTLSPSILASTQGDARCRRKFSKRRTRASVSRGGGWLKEYTLTIASPALRVVQIGEMMQKAGELHPSEWIDRRDRMTAGEQRYFGGTMFKRRGCVVEGRC